MPHHATGLGPRSNGDTDWIRQYHPADRAELTLVCFPHAGGSASFYYPLSAALAPHVEVLAVQYPGRQDRRNEPVVDKIETLADRAYEALRGWTGRNVALFGHSMGATVAFEVARRMEAAAADAAQSEAPRRPRMLIASARRAPSVRTTGDVHRKDDAGIVRELKRLGGTAETLLSDPELRAAMLPAIRGDYTAIETYCAPPDAIIDAPIHIFAALGDELNNLSQVELWRTHTHGDTSLTRFHGGHFYLETWRPDVLSAINAILLRTPALSPTA